MALLLIAWKVIAPIFLMIGVGFGVQRGVGVDVKSLTRLNFWIFVPALLFVKIQESQLSGPDVAHIALHFALLFCTMGALMWNVAKWCGADARMQRSMTSAALFYNSGNYGIPVAQLAFAGGGLAIQVIVLMLQNICNFTIGLALHAGGKPGGSRRQTLGAVLKLPMLYMLAVAWAWRWTGWPIPAPLWEALKILADALVPVALITLGAQMATLKSHRFDRFLTLALFIRLCIGPILAWAFVWLLGLRGMLAQALIVSASFPTAVNSALLALEFDNEPDFAAAVVFYSTLLSALTVSIVIYAVKFLP